MLKRILFYEFGPFFSDDFVKSPSLYETFEEYPILLKFKEGENLNRRNTVKYFEDSAKASLRAEI